MIRPIALSDIPEIAYIEQKEQIAPLSHKTLYNWFADGYTGWVICTEEGDVIGYMVVSALGSECHGVLTCIKGAYQNKGLGRELHQYVFTELKKSGVAVVHFEVRRSNIAVQKMVAHFGAEVIDVRPRYYGNEDGLIMVIRLENFK